MTRFRLSRLNSVNDSKPRAFPLEVLLQEMRSGRATVAGAIDGSPYRSLAEVTEYARQLLADGKTDAYDLIKRDMPQLMPAGVFDTRSDINSFSELVCLEFDGDVDTAYAFMIGAECPHVVAMWRSLSGKPKMLVSVASASVDGEPLDATTFPHAWYSAQCLFEDIGEPDKSAMLVSQLQALCYDPDLFYRPEAVCLDWSVDDDALREFSPSAEAERLLFEALPAEYRDAIAQMEWKPNGWGRASVPCPWGEHEFDGWGSRSNATGIHKNGENDYTFHCLKCPPERRKRRYAPQNRYRRAVKLQKNVVSMLTETLDASREFLKSVFEKKKIKFFGLRADTGVGKNEGAINYFLRGFRGLINVPTTDLAKELEARLDKAEIDSFRYRGILSNPDGVFPDENPCIQPVLYDAIASRGWNTYELLCAGCEFLALCKERGYRSQAENAKQAQVTVMPFPDLFLNPAFRTVAKDYLPTYSDDLSLHDEYDPYNFLEINLPKSRLVRMRDDWKGYDPSQFAKELLRILEVEGELSQLRSLIDGLTDADRDSILEGLTCVMWRRKVLSREDAHRCDDFRHASRHLETIGNLPQLETEDWNLLVLLELFFERYPRDADMPMKYENDTLTFYLPPLPMKTRARMGFMSATLDETAFRRAMDSRQIKRGDVTFHDTGLTQWHPEAKVFQLRTNRNPRATAYTSKGERVDGNLLSPSGEFYYGLVAEDLKNDNRGLITYKALLQALEKEGCIRPSVETANFGGLVGLDTRFKDVDVLHLLFSPELPPSAVEFKAKMMFGNDTEPLCYDRDENGHYIDTRLQACYDDGVIAELLQATGRGRLVSRPVIIVIWCSHFLPGVTDRSQCFLFDEVDWQQADGDLEKLAAVVKAREAAEQHGDVTAYAETTGQSQSTAYRQTEQARRQSKADIDAELLQRILELKTQDIGERDIATQLGISYGKVRSLLKNAEVH